MRRHPDKTYSETYEDKFVRFSDWMERGIRKILVALLILLLLVQCFLRMEPVREKLSPVERMEGVPVEQISADELKTREVLAGGRFFCIIPQSVV